MVEDRARAEGKRPIVRIPEDPRFEAGFWARVESLAPPILGVLMGNSEPPAWIRTLPSFQAGESPSLVRCAIDLAEMVAREIDARRRAQGAP